MSQRTYRTIKPAGFLTLFLWLALLISCEKDSQPQLPPTLQVKLLPGSSGSDFVFAVGDLMTFEISAQKGSENITNLYAIRNSVLQPGLHTLDTSMNIANFSIHKKFTKGLEDKELWTFIIRDKNRLSDTVSLLIYRDTTSVFGSVRLLETVVMSAQNLDVPGNFFSFTEGIFDLDQAGQHQESIDLIYYYYGEDENVIASPGANIESGVFEGDLLEWEIRRTTRFVELDLSSEDFYSAENDSLLIVSYQEGSGKRKAKNLAQGKTYSFQTQNALLGIFRVLGVEGTNAGTIQIDIKIQDK